LNRHFDVKQIEGDLVGKETAFDIDHQTSNLKISGPSKNVSNATRYAVDKNKKVFTPSDWQNFSEANLHVASGQVTLDWPFYAI
jgi:hypothetical protein